MNSSSKMSFFHISICPLDLYFNYNLKSVLEMSYELCEFHNSMKYEESPSGVLHSTTWCFLIKF